MAVLAVGVGANTAAGTIAYGVLLRPLPVTEPDRLIHIRAPLKLADLVEVEARLGAFGTTAAYTVQVATVRGGRDPEHIRVALVHGPFFEVLGATPAKGRWLESESLIEAVASIRYVERSESNDADVLDSSVYVGSRPYTIVGLMPAAFGIPEDKVALWIPARTASPAALFGRGDTRSYSLVMRLRPTIGIESARTEVPRALSDLKLAGVDAASVRVDSLTSAMVGEHSAVLILFLLAALLLLLAACSNVATLLSGRWMDRHKELVVRLTMGGTPSSLVRLVLSESLLLALCGSLIGVLTADMVVASFVALAGDALPRQTSIAVDSQILMGAVGLMLIVALASGIVPAVRIARSPHLVVARERYGVRSARVDKLLLFTQVTTSVFLIIGAGLLAQTVTRILGRGAGVATDNVLVVRLPLPDGTTAAGARPGYVEDVLGTVRGMPGVLAAGVANGLPPSHSLNMSVRMVDSGRRDDSHPLNLVAATAGYLEAVGIVLGRGRWFTESDQSGEPVAVISDRVAREILLVSDPIGKQLPFPVPTRSGKVVRPRVIGVVGDVRYSGLDADALGSVYVRWHDLSVGIPFLVLRVSGEPAGMIPALRRVVHSVDPMTAVPDVQTFDAELRNAIAGRRLRMWLVGVFALLTLSIVLLGLVAVVTRAVNERRKEFAIRSALGASPGSSAVLIVRKYAASVSLGVAVGLAAAALSSSWLDQFLYGISPRDVATYSVGAVLVTVVAGLGCYLPARRAARIAPLHELRNN